MQLARFLSLALGISCVSRVSGKVYTDIQSVSQFIAQLDLSQAVGSRITKLLDGRDAKSISSLAPEKRASLACQMIEIAKDGTFIDSTPPSSAYQDVIDNHWSTTCWLKPLCVTEPSSAAEVSKAITIVTFTGAKFSVRSGGHNPNRGWANNNGGILIDLVNVNEITLSSDGSSVALGPGNRWGNVYSELSKSKKSVLGGRVSHVGVGGYFLGGGLSHFVSQYGNAATNIRNYEIVLANSSVINANANTNSDLYKALKGGGANFGVVTKFEAETVDDSPVWFEGVVYDPSQNRALISALAEYAKAAENDTKASLAFSLTGDVGVVVFIYNSPTVRPPVFSSFYGVPSISHLFNSTVGTWNSAYATIAALTSVAPAREQIGAVSYKFDNATLQESYSTYLDLSAQAKKNYNGTMGFVVQPFTSSAVRKSSLKGGNPLGLSAVSQAWIATQIVWPSSTADNAALNTVQTFENELAIIARSKGTDLRYRFMNDAGFNQDVLASYGNDSLSKLRSVSHSYDSHQVFQELQNNGFLLAKA